MKFIDEALVKVSSGKGGAGMSHFLREKYNAMGGPDGGDGGKGGSVFIRASEDKHTLLDFKYNPIWKAGNGGAGDIRDRTGAAGDDIIIELPVGTQIFSVSEDDNSPKELIVDLKYNGQEYTLLRGGKGGKGNTFFKSSTNQSPKHAQPGIPGQKASFLLNLKLVADVGLVGFPNAGKSTLISVVSNANPKIADYPFTTLTPNLGVVRGKGRDFTIADVPGIISGASHGKGLGTTFLKHIERTAVLAYVIDPFALDGEGKSISPEENYRQLKEELRQYAEQNNKFYLQNGAPESQEPDLNEFRHKLTRQPAILIITKRDLVSDSQAEEILCTLRDLETSDLRTCFVSAASHQNLDVMKGIFERLITGQEEESVSPQEF